MGKLYGIKKIVFVAVVTVSMPCLADEYELGLMAWSEGHYQQAAGYFMAAAEQGSIGAKQMLVTMYQRQQGVPKDPQQQFNWLAQVAGSGIPRARYELARLLEQQADPRQASENLTQALAWYQLAADDNYHPAWLALARFHEQGLGGLDRNHAQARRYYGMAAAEYLVFSQKGDAGAQNQLAMMYEQGKGVKQDLAQAVYWYQKAANQQLADAEYNLGRLYAEGRGVTRNEMLAVKLARSAAEHGSSQARAMLEEMAAKGVAGVASRD